MTSQVEFKEYPSQKRVDLSHDSLFLVRLDDALSHLDELLGALSGSAKEKAFRYIHDADRARSAVGALLSRMVADGRPIKVTPQGKPYVEGGPYFSLSHSGDFIGIYVSATPCGFDLEPIERCDPKLAPAALTEVERRDVHDHSTMAEAWTRKEALAKCEGSGILMPTKEGFVHLGGNIYDYKDATYYAWSFSAEGHTLTCCNAKNVACPTPFVLPAPLILGK